MKRCSHRLRAWHSQPGRSAAIVRDTKGLGPAALDAFANGADNLSIEVLKDLTRVMLGGYVIFDAESGMLKSAYANDPPALAGIPPEPYVNPDPTIAQAQAAYRAALKAARGPERRGPELAKPELVQTTTKRAGFLGDFFRSPYSRQRLREKKNSYA